MKTSSAAGSAAKPEKDGRQTMAVTLLWCLMGVLLPRAALYGEMAPFGISLAAAAEGCTLPVLAALIAGYMLADNVTLPLRYAAAVAVVGGIHWILAALPPLRRSRAVPPLTAFFACLVTGMLMLSRTGSDSYRVLLLFAESAVAAGCAAFFRTAMRWTSHLADKDAPALSAGGQAAVILTGAVAVMAASTLTVHGFAPGRVAAALLVLVLGRSGRESGGCMAGVIVGAATALAAPGQTALAVALAFGGLLAGLFSRFGRVAEALAFLIGSGIIALTDTGDEVLLRLYELFAAAVLFMLMPKSLDRRLSHLFIRGRDLPAVEGLRRSVTMRLRVAAAAIDDMSSTVSGVSERLARHGAPDAAAVCRAAGQAVCGICPLHALCWEQHAAEAQASLDAVIPLLQQNGHIAAEDLTGFIRQRCRQPDRLAAYLDRSYALCLTRRTAWQRLRDIQSSVNSQFGGMSSLLSAMAAAVEDPRQIDTELSARVMTVCEDFGMPVQDAVCARSGGNRLTVDIVAGDAGVRLDRGRWLQEIREACGRDFAPPTAVPSGKLLHITLTEQPRYTVEQGLAQLCCGEEKLCGDAADVFSVGGSTVALLSDGMGSGGRAAVDGAMAVGLTARLWQAGFDPDSILPMVNAALLVKSEEESLATLDAASIDTFSGRLDLCKAGAAPSLLRSGGRVSRLEQPSLPVGILPDVRFEHMHDWLAAEDILLLVSDGALSGGLAPVEVLLRDFPSDGSMQQLAEQIAAAARAAQGEHQDDITVLALRLHRAGTQTGAADPAAGTRAPARRSRRPGRPSAPGAEDGATA